MERQVRIETPLAPPSTGFRSQGLLAEGFLFTAGQIGVPLMAPGRVGAPPERLEDQVALGLEHLRQVTLAASVDPERVVEVSAFLVPEGRAEAVRRQVAAFLSADPPLFHAEQVADVALHGSLELDWIALQDDRRSAADAAEILAPLGQDVGARRSGPFVILNGVTGEGGTLAEQTRDALRRADTVLLRHGSALAAVAKMNVYIADFESYPQFNEVTKEMFRASIPPARSVLVAPRSCSPALLRVDLLAVLTAATGPL